MRHYALTLFYLSGDSITSNELHIASKKASEHVGQANAKLFSMIRIEVQYNYVAGRWRPSGLAEFGELY